MRSSRALVAGIGLVAGLAAQPVRGLQFNFTPAAETPQHVIDAFRIAGDRWSANFNDDITVNIRISFVSMEQNLLGETTSTQGLYTYSGARDRMVADATSANDLSAVSFLATGNGVSMLLNRTSNSPHGSGSATPYLDSDNDANNTQLRMSRANAKALGLVGAQSAVNDASIVFNSRFNWDFDPTDGVTSGAFDFVGIATHEIGHALGFLSGVDVLDRTSIPQRDDQLTQLNPMDLFRFSTDSIAHGTGVIDFTADARDKYFSLDGGTTKIMSFATGATHGDGRQASHWKDNRSAGIMDPTSAPGELLTISHLDRRLFDVIGFDLNRSWLWVEPDGGIWSRALNWSAVGVPNDEIDAIFEADSAYAVTFNAAATAQSVHIGSGEVGFELNGRVLSVGTDLVVSGPADASSSLTIRGPGSVSALALHIGGLAGAGGSGRVSIEDGITINIRGITDAEGLVKVWDGGSALELAGGMLQTDLLENAGAVTISGGTLSTHSIENRGEFLQTGGTLAITGSLINAGGLSSIGGIQSWGEGARLMVDGGVVLLLTDAGAADAQRLTVEVAAGASILFHSTQHLRELILAGGTGGVVADGLLVTGALSMAESSELDLGTGAMVVRPGEEQAPIVLAELSALIAQGRNGGVWDGPGINSSSAAADVQGLSGLAIMLNQDRSGMPVHESFLGEPVDANSILIRYTSNGDVDLSGILDIDDYFLIDTGFLDFQAGVLPNPRYQDGDLDFSGVIDIDDYFLIDMAFLGQGGVMQAFTGLRAMAVPEATGLAWAGACLAMMGRRQRASRNRPR